VVVVFYTIGYTARHACVTPVHNDNNNNKNDIAGGWAPVRQTPHRTAAAHADMVFGTRGTRAVAQAVKESRQRCRGTARRPPRCRAVRGVSNQQQQQQQQPTRTRYYRSARSCLRFSHRHAAPSPELAVADGGYGAASAGRRNNLGPVRT